MTGYTSQFGAWKSVNYFHAAMKDAGGWMQFFALILQMQLKEPLTSPPYKDRRIPGERCS